MPNEMPDMEAYAAALQRVMAEALVQAEALQAEAAADRAAAAADRDKTNDMLRTWENQALRQVEDSVLTLRQEVEADVITVVKAKLLNSGKPAAEVERLLQIITNP